MWVAGVVILFSEAAPFSEAGQPTETLSMITAIIVERVSKANGQPENFANSVQVASENEKSDSASHAAEGGCCPLHPAEPLPAENHDTVQSQAASFPGYVLLNMLGGLTLAAGHTRNFLLCRKSNCSHEDDCS